MEGYLKNGDKIFVKNYITPDNLYDPENAEYISLDQKEPVVFYKTEKRALLTDFPRGDVSYHKNGRIKVKITRGKEKIVNFESYYEDGAIESKSNEWKDGYAYGNDYYYYPNGTIKDIRIRINGNFGGWKKYFPNGDLQYCRMGNYIIEFYENRKVKHYMKIINNNIKYDIRWNNDGDIEMATFGIENDKYLVYKYTHNTLMQKYIEYKYTCEANLYYIKDGKEADNSFFKKLYYFNDLNSYKDFLPEIKIPDIDWETYLVDTGIPCQEI
jgi:hypothetical protein